MFTRTFSESRQREVELHEMPAEGFQGVLTFLYSGELALSDSNAEPVLLAADRCEVLGLVNLCCNFLLDRISWHNCLHYYSARTRAARVEVPGMVTLVWYHTKVYHAGPEKTSEIAR